MPSGHLLSIHMRFSGKKRISLYKSQEKGNYYFIQTRHNDFSFSHYNLFLGKLKENLARKVHVHVNTDGSLSDCAHANAHVLWDPIILL